MKIFIGQIYIKPGINFPFSHHFQKWLSEKLSELASPSAEFLRLYDADYSLIFRMSAKTGIEDVEIKGPTIFKKDKDVEYTVFLPYDVISLKQERFVCALEYFFQATVRVFESLEIDATALKQDMPLLIKRVCSDSSMFET